VCACACVCCVLTRARAGNLKQGKITKKPTADCAGKTNYKVSGQVHWFGNCAKGGDAPPSARDGRKFHAVSSLGLC